MTSSGSSHSRFQPSFLQWITVQRADLEDLLQALAVDPEADTERLHAASQKAIQHLNDYQQTRSAHQSGDALSMIYTPSSFENSMFWIGGFKPSNYIRLVYSTAEIGASNLELELWELLKALHAETVESEERILGRMGDLQECMAVEPLEVVGGGVERGLAAHRVAFNGVVADADGLRVKVLKKLVEQILTPRQGVHLLVAATRLHLSIHEWGKSCFETSCLQRMSALQQFFQKEFNCLGTKGINSTLIS